MESSIIGFKSQFCLLLANYFISLLPHVNSGVNNEYLSGVVTEIDWDNVPDTLGI